ncbi:SWIM zinc finger family protein [Myroides odoratimimus]|uniref:SWIM zinc finger family protein n=1 Tax=Myroides odoratimimus TaxID=76832 RepID=UPI002DBC1972|nr:SWIM zinc finger family protein [Myroides odoratimimus]MEC4077516.1 SWIM zinc finger family protein [Myroides odoratimimus]
MNNLFNFETNVSNIILKRGFEYYEQGMVKDITKLGDYIYEGEVEGNDDYTVVIELDKSQSIKDYNCDCPYDGAVCKHVVAVLYQLRDDMTIEVVPKKTKKVKRMSFKDLVEQLSIEDLREFIFISAKKDARLKVSLEAYFVDRDDTVDIKEKYKEVFRKIIKQHTSRGFVSYTETKKLSKELEIYLGRVNELIAERNYRDACSIIQVFIEEAIDVITFSDDSNGYFSDLIFKAIEILDSIIEADITIEFKESLISFFEEELAKEVYFDYGDFGYELLGSFELLCLKIFKEEFYLTFLDKKIKESNSEEYRIRHFTNVRLSFLGKIGREEQLNQEMLDNISIPEVRRNLVQREMMHGEYEKAKILLIEGIKIAEELKHRGTVNQWELILLEIAELEKDVERMRYFYNKQVFFGWQINKSYYSKLKATFTKEEWTVIIEEKINSLISEAKSKVKQHSMFNSNPYDGLVNSVGVLYSLEGYVDRLFDLLKKVSRLDLVLPYLKYIKKEYTVDVIFDVLRPLIVLEADRANNRSDYKNIGNLLISLKKEFPQAVGIIDSIVDEMKKKYPKRPAMLDEFNKV